MVIITFSSHDRYSSLLRPFLYSVSKAIEDASIKVIYYDYRQDRLSAIKHTFPNVEFIKIEADSKYDFHKVNSGRMRHFREILNTIPDGENVAFLDCDTLVLKDFSSVFENDFDIASTYKDTDFPINLGVLFGKNSDKLKLFFDYMVGGIDAIFNSNLLTTEARLKSGAADQHCINKIAFKNKKIPFYQDFSQASRREVYGKYVNTDNTGFRMIFLPCNEYNQTECVPLNGEQYILHFKAGWHPILNNEHAPVFTNNRPQVKCNDMFFYWRNINKKICKDYSNSSLFVLKKYLSKNELNSDNLSISTNEFNKISRLKVVDIPVFKGDTILEEIEKIFGGDCDIFAIRFLVDGVNVSELRENFKFVAIDGVNIFVFPLDRFFNKNIEGRKDLAYYFSKLLEVSSGQVYEIIVRSKERFLT